MTKRVRIKENLIKFAFITVLLISLISTGTAQTTYSSVTITDVEPTELNPGDTQKVTFTVSNEGSKEARNVKLAFEGSQYVSVVGSTIKSIDWLHERSTQEMTINVHVNEEAPAGSYNIPIACTWFEKETMISDGQSQTVLTPKTSQLGMGFNVRGEASVNLGNVVTDPASIRPGDQNVKISAYIGNSGESSVENLEARLRTTDEFETSWSGTDRSYLGKLIPGQPPKEAVFHLDIGEGIESKKYNLSLLIKYEDIDEVEHQVEKYIEILVEPKPDFEISSFYTSPANISAGEHIKLYVTVKNTGSEKAESISARSIGEVEVPFDFSVKSDFVGKLEPGETGEAILEFDVEEDASPKVYPQGIEIRCTGDRDIGDFNVYVFDEQIRLKVDDDTGSRGLIPAIPGFEGFLSLLALAFILIIFKGSKRRGE
ncbi:MAG: NEW3 domain-containing protein [Archaeoglobaceae archaeon]